MTRAAAIRDTKVIRDNLRAEFATILICDQAKQEAAALASEHAIDRVPVLVRKARSKLLSAARTCTDPETAKELRHIAQRCGWFLADIRRNIGRQNRGA
ncbi:hypothetical protein [Tahibacter harae]|uniref:Uncharacterized protein n=1 Tax=Tahibacter harae TaxID=2963937 RepID=A0ABT1QQZ6_9GAMM|nr:hypothetical protein [Tahibacter harae]MCQ4164693.1 hypothetical protein [Tahibacter harae]